MHIMERILVGKLTAELGPHRFRVQRDVRIGDNLSGFASHVDGCFGLLCEWKPWALRSLATLAFGGSAHIATAPVVLGARKTMVVLVEAADAIFRYASTTTTMIFSGAPKSCMSF